jgi:hypothetical protein
MLVFLLMVLIGAFAGWYWNQIPEPEYDGVKLGSCLDFTTLEAWNHSRMVAKALGSKAVPYLTAVASPPSYFDQKYRAFYMQQPRNRWSFLPSPFVRESRRMRAVALLMETGTNCVPSLPVLINIVRTERRSGPRQNAVNTLGKFAPGTAVESEAFAALKMAAEDGEDDHDFLRLVYYALGSFTNQADIVAPMLISHLKEPGMFSNCSAGLLKLGIKALPAVRAAASQESGTIRPATVVLEKMTPN